MGKPVGCNVDKCDRPHLAKGLCSLHYNREYRGKELGGAELLRGTAIRSLDGLCVVEGCDQPRYAVQNRSMCNHHYMKQYKHGDPFYVTPPAHTDVTGQRFGSLVASSHLGKSKWLLECDCGASREAKLHLLMKTNYPTCGDRSVHINPSYFNAHLLVKRAKGPASTHLCACGAPARHWAYDHSDPEELFSSGHSVSPMPYSMDPAHYFPACVKCHKRYDLEYLKEIR